jgi:hypothetical protein
VLRNNGANDLPISANGSFAFSTPLQTGTTYSVTVKTQPSVYAQTCTVTNGSAVIGTSNITNVQIKCGSVVSITLTGVGGQIPDGRSGCGGTWGGGGFGGPGGPGGPGGFGGFPRTSDIVVATSYFTVSTLTVTLTNLNHTFAGDLTAELQHVDTGKTVSLFKRVGMTINTQCGSQSSFKGTYRFDDAFTGNLWSFPNNAPLITPANYYPTTTAGAKSILDAPPSGFRGESVAGTWRLIMTDAVAGDTGSFDSWTILLKP